MFPMAKFTLKGKSEHWYRWEKRLGAIDGRTFGCLAPNPKFAGSSV